LLTLGNAAPAFEPAPVDAILTETLKAWHVPGLAAVIVHGDEVVYLKGHGVREMGKTEPVTSDTLFGIGSLTKAFTATAIGILVDDAKADWDDHVRKHLPTFRLADPLADRDVTLRDLLCHRTGIARHDLLWYRSPWPIEESVRRMAFLEPAHSFRSTYRYNNIAYSAAGLALAQTAKMPWHEFVQKRLFDPLGMTSSVFTRTGAEKAADHASPHHRRGLDRFEVIPWYPDDKQVRGSGSIKSTGRDLARWLRLQLNEGVCEGKRVVSARSLAETHRPQIVEPVDPDRARLAGTTQVSYGLGWHILDYRGHHLLEHGGAVDGFRARILLLPRDRYGIVLLVNVDETAVLNAAGNLLLDHLLGLSKKEWQQHYLARRSDREMLVTLPQRIPNTKPSRQLDAYAGVYKEPAYGQVRITLEDGALQLAWSSFRLSLEHLHYDTFTYGDIGGNGAGTVGFTLRSDGEVGSIRFLERTFSRGK
jgi:CubicO group peptidase (beta-lactamase class C family)